MGLLEKDSGAFFVGDSLLDFAQPYDGEPPEYSDDADPIAFRKSYERLLELDIVNIYPGHGSPFDRARMTRIIREYLEI